MSAPVAPEPAALPPEQVLANAHLLRTQHGWNQSDTDGYVQEQTGLPGMVALASAISQRPTVDEGPPGALASGATSFGRGASFNFADRLSGGVDALLAALKHGATDPATLALAAAQHPDIGQAYAGGRDEARQYYAAADQAHPVLDKVANAAGNVASTLAGGAALKAPATLLGAGLQGAGIGAGSAGLATLGNQQDLTDPSAYLNAGKAAGVGGAVGFPLGMLGAFVGRQLFGSPAQLAAKGIAAGGGEDALRSAEQELVAAGKEGQLVPADLSPQLQNLAGSALKQSTPDVAEPIGAALRARTAGQPQRIAASLQDLFGQSLDTPARVRQLVQLARDIAKDPEEGYGALNEAVGPIMDPRLIELLSRPGVQDAYQQALKNIATAGGPRISAAAFNAGQEAAPEALSFQVLNGTRRMLRDAATGAFAREGAGGYTGSSLAKAADDLTSVLSDNVPEFADLQARYATAKGAREAVDAAGNVASRSLSDLRDHVADLTPEQLPEFRRALASNIYDQLASARTTRGIAGTLLEDPAWRAKIQTAFGDMDTFNRFLDGVGAERTFQTTGALAGARGPLGAPTPMGSSMPGSVGVSLHEGFPKPYYFLHGLHMSPSTSANPLAKALLTPSSVDQFLQTIQALQQRGLGLQRGLTALPGMAASPLTQP